MWYVQLVTDCPYGPTLTGYQGQMGVNDPDPLRISVVPVVFRKVTGCCRAQASGAGQGSTLRASPGQCQADWGDH